MIARLRVDQGGAIALLALFMAVFMTALVYYVAGIGESLLQRERMQDAADAAAFSAAVLHARGMNTIVLVNMVMAALLAVLVALKLVELLITMAILAIAIASFFAPGLAGAIPPLAQARHDVQTAHDQLRPSIYGALDALHTAARGVRVLVPAASQQRAIESVRAHYHPPAQAGFALPPRATLPTQDGSFSTLCDRAGQYTGGLTTWVLDPVMPSEVASLIGGAVKDLTQSRADWFCGTDGHPPRTKVEHEYEYPFLAARERCSQFDSQAPDYAQNDADEHARLCARAESDEQDSTPNEHTGRCATRCEEDGPYEQRAARARYACAPDQDEDNDLYAFGWQERKYSRTY
ncbi:MAG TPA: pilus assembly protein TadG-related protein, partial [Polyangiales bacterium]|nr:pilus assembly protein TadG-related protein [Polyangiales bacterium]